VLARLLSAALLVVAVGHGTDSLASLAAAHARRAVAAHMARHASRRGEQRLRHVRCHYVHQLWKTTLLTIRHFLLNLMRHRAVLGCHQAAHQPTPDTLLSAIGHIPPEAASICQNTCRRPPPGGRCPFHPPGRLLARDLGGASFWQKTSSISAQAARPHQQHFRTVLEDLEARALQ